MILNETQSKLITKGIEGQSFKIATTAKVFEILSSLVYSDPIKAIIRELGTNALDAHVEASRNKPFKLHLPNNFDSTFKIRDFGTGLSRGDIENLYSTYFDSDKTESNKQTGCFGIGSKSPFAYTDNFTVISYFFGKRFEYIAYKQKDGVPAITFISETETKDPNGLEVSFPVKEEDFARFKLSAQDVYFWFPKNSVEGFDSYEDYISVIDGDDDSEIHTLEKTAHPRLNSLSGLYVLMGNVLYPISDAQLRELKKKSYVKLLTEDFGFVDSFITGISYLNKDIVIIKIPIGFINPTPSRESLQFNEESKRKFFELIEKKCNVSINKIKEEIKNAPNYYEAVQKYKELSKQYLYSHAISKLGLKYDDKNLNTERISTTFYSRRVRFNGAKTSVVKVDWVSVPAKNVFVSTAGQEYSKIEYYARKLVREHNDIKSVYIIDAHRTEEFKDCIGVDDSYILNLDDLISKYNLKVRINSKQNSSRERKKVCYIKGLFDNSRHYTFVKRDLIDVIEWAKANNEKVILTCAKRSESEVYNFLAAYQSYKNVKANVINSIVLTSEANYERITKKKYTKLLNKQLLDGFEYVTIHDIYREVKQIYDSLPEKFEFANTNGLNNYEKFLPHVTSKIYENLMEEIHDDLEENSQGAITEKNQGKINLSRAYAYLLNLPVKGTFVQKLVDTKILDRYPLIRRVDFYYLSDPTIVKELNNYINLVDKSNPQP